MPDFNKVTRIEVIDDIKGRDYVRWHINVSAVSVQDEGRTLKIFVEEERDA